MLQDKILDFLRSKPGYASGEEIAQRLKISRQALWKHIQALKEAGYEITAVPHLGYQLTASPDRLFPSEISTHLITRILGKKIYYFECLSSTMDLAAELALKNAPEGTVVIAESQSRGRGRLGREWFSPRHKGIYFSVILRPKVAPLQAPVFTLLSAVSVCEAVKRASGLDAQIKWPNDLLLENKKIGGILTELNAEMDEVRFVVIGIGINVNNEAKSLLPHATSLKEEAGLALSRVSLLQEILRALEENYLVFQKRLAGPVLEKWRLHNQTLGRRVKVSAHRHHIEGEALDIDSDGSLLVRSDSGLVEKVACGDVTHCR
jgi:BirA family biotin operon repressor/biotin-[acetyl-CoA-carboxylase] ligase